MSLFEYQMAKVEILEGAANRCVANGKRDMGKMWRDMADKLRVQVGELNIFEACKEVM